MFSWFESNPFGMSFAAVVGAAFLLVAAGGESSADAHGAHAIGRPADPLETVGLTQAPRARSLDRIGYEPFITPDYPLARIAPASGANFTDAERPTDSEPVSIVVIHVAEGSASAASAWFANSRAKGSSHYIVAWEGQILQPVPERAIAWHAGNWSYNEQSIGIEHAGYTYTGGFPDRLYEASAQLTAAVLRRYAIAPDRAHVIGHNEVPDPLSASRFGGASHHTDPGPYWAWPRYMAYVRAAARTTTQQRLIARRSSRDRSFRVRTPHSGSWDAFVWSDCTTTVPMRTTSATLAITTAAVTRTRRAALSRGCARQWLGSMRLEAGATAIRLSAASSKTLVPRTLLLVAATDPNSPRPPAQLTATSTVEGVELAWPIASDDNGLWGYEIQMGNETELVYSADATTLMLPGASCGPDASLSIVSLDLAGNRSSPTTTTCTLSTP